MNQNTKVKKYTPVATVSDYRLAIWPVSKNTNAGTRVSKWGSFKVVRGSVTARHRDVLDVIMSLSIDTEYVKSSITGEVEMHILYDALEVLKMLNTTATNAWLKSMIVDMQATVISIQNKNGDWPDSWSLISFSGDSKKEAERQSKEFPAKLKKIVLSPGAVRWMSKDIQVFIKKDLMKNIMSLKNQVSRSVAKWFLSHSNSQNHSIDSVLMSVGCTGGSRQMNNRIHQIIEDTEGLKKLGIKIGTTIYSVKIDGVYYKNPFSESD